MHFRNVVARGARAAGLGVLLISTSGAVAAQTPAPKPPKPIDHSQHQHPAPATGTSPIDLPHSRMGSGTSWLPDATPMYAVHWQFRDWDVMAHGHAFLQFLADGGDRGHQQFGSINWVMGMGSRPLGTGRLGVRGMFSLEPLTIAGCGYPDLLASGELCDDRPIVDRQHPHDLFMELAGQYDQPLTETLALQVYAGLAGEPALGPVAFPHRMSATSNPLAPLSHHWLDSTHIAFGVLTGGIYARTWKAETSLFNGREPDEGRYDLDLGALDSVSARFWYLPTDQLAFQVSAGHLEEAEQDEVSRVDVDRVTASVTYHRPFREGSSIWASTLAWGQNRETGRSTGFVLAETNVTFDDQDTWFGRLEIGGKTAHDLDVHGSDRVFTVAKVQAGYTRYFEPWYGLKPGVGATLSMSLVPNALNPPYGNRAMFGLGLFVTLRPAAMDMGARGGTLAKR